MEDVHALHIVLLAQLGRETRLVCYNFGEQLLIVRQKLRGFSGVGVWEGKEAPNPQESALLVNFRFSFALGAMEAALGVERHQYAH